MLQGYSVVSALVPDFMALAGLHRGSLLSGVRREAATRSPWSLNSTTTPRGQAVAAATGRIRPSPSVSWASGWKAAAFGVICGHVL